jgi:hypothetical protein
MIKKVAESNLEPGHQLLNRFNQTDPDLLKGPIEKAEQQKHYQPEPADEKARRAAAYF